MGWASAGDIFDPVARALVELSAPDPIKLRVLTVLIEELQKRGWDTESESLGEFQDDPAIVDAFRANEITQDHWNEEDE